MDDLNRRTRAEVDPQLRPRGRIRATRERGASERLAEGLVRRPDRIALWAFVLAIGVTIAAAASSQASSGGVAIEPAEGGCPDAELGERRLALGDCGEDVKTLNLILKSKSYQRGVGGKAFEDPTERTVREFQEREGLRSSGVADSRTQSELVKTMARSIATWYGPGFYGSRTACGKKLKRGTVGVAHKTLPCGTKATFAYKGKFLTTKVIDRGPYANGASWDLTHGAAKELGFRTTDTIRSAVAR